MVWRIDRSAPLAVLALTLLLSPAAIAAPAGETQEALPPAAQEPDSPSYLPPWMQKRDVAGIGNGSPGTPDPNNPIAAQRPAVSGQAPKQPHRHRNDFPFLPRFW
ncbi:MAG: hypothetical protein ACLPPF_23055 [Rhodomicrobium sp.]